MNIPLKLFQIPVYMRLLTQFRQLKFITLKQHLCLRQWKRSAWLLQR